MKNNKINFDTDTILLANKLFNRTRAKHHKTCYLYNSKLYTYQEIEKLIFSQESNQLYKFNILNKGLTIMLNNKPIQKIVINYKKLTIR